MIDRNRINLLEISPDLETIAKDYWTWTVKQRYPDYPESKPPDRYILRYFNINVSDTMKKNTYKFNNVRDKGKKDFRKYIEIKNIKDIVEIEEKVN